MKTIIIFSAIVFILVIAITYANRVDKYNKKYSKKRKNKKSEDDKKYRIREHTRNSDGSKYYSLELARIGYQGQWGYACTNGHEHSDTYGVTLQTYQTIEEAEIDAEKRIERNIKAHKEYQDRQYSSKIIKQN